MNSLAATADPSELVPEEDHYAEHLAEVNETREVVSTRDIVNSRGVLLCRQGSRIDRSVAARLVKHKVVGALEEQVSIRGALDGRSLHERLLGLLQRYPDLQRIQEGNGFAPDCERLFTREALHPSLSQKLTVLDERMPQQLEKGLFCAWLSALTARNMGLSRDLESAVFVAGLVHDLGFLHISPAILDKRGGLEPAEWRAIQAHVVIGKLLLESIPGIHPRAARAVLEHHERCDGSGYPVGRTEEDLDELGQIVGLADSIQAIRIQQFEKKGRNLRDLKPYLLLNTTTHFYPVFKATCQIIDRSELKPTLVDPEADIAALAKRLLQRGQAVRQAVNILTQPRVYEISAAHSDYSVGRSLLKITSHVLVMTAQSGLVNQDLYGWLDRISREANPDTLLELNDLDLMLNELSWQVNNARRAFDAFVEAGCARSDSARALIAQASAEVGEAMKSASKHRGR